MSKKKRKFFGIEKSGYAEIFISTRHALEVALKELKIPIWRWRTKKGYKTVGHLWEEIFQKETRLLRDYGAEHENHNLIRLTRKVYIDVYCWNGDRLLCLREAIQLFRGGGQRKRSSWNRPSIGEKLHISESDWLGLKRGLKEELGISNGYRIISIGNPRKKMSNSKSYPGLRSLSTIYSYQIFLTRKDWKKGGYIERQKDKETRFRWRCVPKSY